MQVQAQNQGYHNNQGNRNAHQGNRNSYYEEAIGNLSNQVRLLQDENAKLIGMIHSLQQEMRELKQQTQAQKNEMAQMRRMIIKESDARQKQLGNIADRLQNAADAQARADAEARARARAEAEARARENARAQDKEQAQEEYDFYVVEAGATLSAVSRAAGVSVEQLKKINGLKNNTIRVGQKLKIPRK
jgi:LysM repeat protein